MPLQKTDDRDLERITLTDPGEWVAVKRALGKDDERRRDGILMRGQRLGRGERAEKFDVGALYEAVPFATLVVAIRDWNVIDPVTGRKAELTEENLRALSDADMAIINARFEELYAPPRTDDERKNSSGAGAPSSAEKAPPASSDGSS